MFFPEKIKNIGFEDKVLEIGPGATPYYRSDVFLERNFNTSEEKILQRGKLEQDLNTEKKVVYYDGGEFPFDDNYFDYVICSHVLEHVDNVPLFIKEITRVSKKGYMEFPNYNFEILYNIDVHVNICKYNYANNTIEYMKKKDSVIPVLSKFNNFINDGMDKGYLSDLYNYVSRYGIDGFEWFNSISLNEVYNFNSFSDVEIPKLLESASKPKSSTLKNLIKRIIKI